MSNFLALAQFFKLLLTRKRTSHENGLGRSSSHELSLRDKTGRSIPVREVDIHTRYNGSEVGSCLSCRVDYPELRELVYLTVELHVGIVAGRPAHAREVVRGSVVAAPPPLLTIRSMVPLAAVESVVAMMVVLQTVQQFGLECINDTKFRSQWR